MLEKDPDNRLVARGQRFRLPAEVIRDQALWTAGLLVDKQGGPSVKPYMPEAVWDETSVYGDMRNYKADQGEGLYRRSLARPPTDAERASALDLVRAAPNPTAGIEDLIWALTMLPEFQLLR
jgi:hypothetical protein